MFHHTRTGWPAAAGVRGDAAGDLRPASARHREERRVRRHHAVVRVGDHDRLVQPRQDLARQLELPLHRPLLREHPERLRIRRDVDRPRLVRERAQRRDAVAHARRDQRREQLGLACLPMGQCAFGLLVDARELQRARHRHHRADRERAGQRDPEPQGAHRRGERVAQRAFEPFPGRAHPPASIRVAVRTSARSGRACPTCADPRGAATSLMKR
jgi:hypothetical protein